MKIVTLIGATGAMGIALSLAASDNSGAANLLVGTLILSSLGAVGFAFMGNGDAAPSLAPEDDSY